MGLDFYFILQISYRFFINIFNSVGGFRNGNMKGLMEKLVVLKGKFELKGSMQRIPPNFVFCYLLELGDWV